MACQSIWALMLPQSSCTVANWNSLSKTNVPGCRFRFPVGGPSLAEKSDQYGQAFSCVPGIRSVQCSPDAKYDPSSAAIRYAANEMLWRRIIVPPSVVFGHPSLLVYNAGPRAFSSTASSTAAVQPTVSFPPCA